MRLWNFYIIVLLVTSSSTIIPASTPTALSSSDTTGWAGIMGADKMMERFLNYMDRYHMGAIAAVLCTVWAVGKIQKENPDFFSSVIRTLEWPFFVAEKKLQKLFCNGKSLTWNELASWHNRIYKLLSPLTKSTSVLDLTKDRRLKAIDAEDENTVKDQTWTKQIIHIDRELTFLGNILDERLRYYKDQHKNTSTNFIKSAGKRLIRTSLNRNEEIAFGLEEIKHYLSETNEYFQSLTHASALDKEHLKKQIHAICSSFEHLGTLVDEVSAADKTKKKIPMVSDTTRGYSGVGAHDYGQSTYGFNGGI